MAAGAAGVIAVAGVTLRFSDEIRRNYPNIVGWTADGLQVASPCDPSSATTIVEFGPGATTAQIATTVSGVMVGSTTPSTRGGEVAASTTAQPEVVTAPVSPDCPSAAQGSGVVPWSAVGIDPATAARLIGRPRVFVSADGEQFTAAATPAVGDGEGNGQVRALSTSDGYALLVTSANQANGKTDAQLLTSTDGMAWTAHEILTRYPVAFGELADGSLAVTGSDASGQASSDVLRDGVVQSTRLAGLLEPSEAGSTLSPEYAAAAVGDSGITIVASVVNQSSTSRSPQIVLHSDDGLQWSRQNLADLAGLTPVNATATRVTDAGSQVLISMQHLPAATTTANPSDQTAVATTVEPGAGAANTPMPETVVLIGTPKG